MVYGPFRLGRMYKQTDSSLGLITTITIMWITTYTVYCKQAPWTSTVSPTKHCSFRFDSIVNQYLAEHCGRNPATSTEIGIIVNSRCDFFSSVSYPGVVDLGLRVSKLGKTSVTYEIGVFEQEGEDVKAVGGFTHVFCDRKTFRPQAAGMCKEVREGLERLLVKEQAKLWLGMPCGCSIQVLVLSFCQIIPYTIEGFIKEWNDCVLNAQQLDVYRCCHSVCIPS